MLLDKELWPSIKNFLLIDRKQSDKPSAISANKSRFHILAAYFSTLDFNRDNFTLFIGDMKQMGYSASYLNNFIKMAKLICRYFKITDVADFTYFPEKKSIPLVIVLPDEIKALADVVLPYKKRADYINARQKALIMLMGTTGCRIGEALGLTFEDLYPSPQCCIFRDTKTNDDRTVPLSQGVYDLLLSLSRLGRYVFMSGRSKRLQQHQINRDLKVRAEAVNIKKNVYCHLFRHSYITTMLENGVDVSDVGVLVGHHDPKTTMRYKNSLIGHYVDIAHMHPLLRQEMSWEQQVSLILMLCKRLLKTNSSEVQVTESGDSVVLTLKRKYNQPISTASGGDN